jgi:uncharacterized protein
MFALGMLSGGGYDLPMDRAVAQHWFRAAAERGHAEAQKMLGRYLARGLAGERDPEAARLWLGRAAAQGLADAKLDLASMRPVPPTQPSERVRGATYLTSL